jgi:hypothetical protein
MTSQAHAQPLIIFVHLPKTAGSTLVRIIERQYPASSILRLYESDFGDELAGIPSSQMDRLRVVLGHFYFGVHAFSSRPVRYITFLRDPIERIISHYYYVRQSPTHYFYDSAQKMSMAKFVEYCSDNDQTRQLAGRCGVPSLGTSSDELLNVAKSNLTKYFPVVGITEEFDRSLILMKRVLEWNYPVYTSQNVTRDRPRKNDIPQDALDVIRKHNELDQELYRYAQKVLQKEIDAQGPTFDNELRRFRKLNSAYGKLDGLLSSVRRAGIPVAARFTRRHT